MKIYAGSCNGEKLDACKSLGCGVMICTTTRIDLNKGWRGMSCALDNGGFRNWQRGFPFQRDAFFRQIEACYLNGIDLDWIVCPDLVARGRQSLNFSIDWMQGELKSAPRLALVMQDGMAVQDLKDVALFDRFPQVVCLFVGGTVPWKWTTAKQWIEYAHLNNRKCHIGQCGQLDFLKRAAAMGADSCDSTSFARHDSWHIIEEYLDPKQGVLEMEHGLEQKRN